MSRRVLVRELSEVPSFASEAEAERWLMTHVLSLELLWRELGPGRLGEVPGASGRRGPRPTPGTAVPRSFLNGPERSEPY